MDCAEEVAILKREVGPLVGGPENLAFDVMRGKMTVLGGTSVGVTQIQTAIRKTGMKAEPWPLTADQEEATQERTFWGKHGRNIATAVSGTFSALGFTVHAYMAGDVSAALGSEGLGLVHEVPAIAKVFYSISLVAGSWYVIPKALYALRRRMPDMNLLMTIAVIGAVLIGEWLEGALVAFLFSVSLALEAWSVGRARRAVEALLELAPPTVRVLVNGQIKETPAEEVPVGTLFLVKPGDRIPLDGEVIKGASAVNQAPITGESVPVLKESPLPVYAGTINGDGALEVKSTKVAGETTLANIIKQVGSAQAKRAPSEQWVEKFARYYTPVVFIAAILVFLVPPLIFGGAWSEWTYRALVLLVIGCPCALVISTPVSIVAALTASARNGVLIKGGAYVEAPARLKAIAMDKTGTLTEGTPRVTRVVAQPGYTESQVLELAASMEAHSDHPLARAIVDYARLHNVAMQNVVDFVAIQGKGATAVLGGKKYWLGSHRYLEEAREETPDVHRQLEELSAAGQSVVVIGDDKEVVGMIALADAIRSQSATIVSALRQAGVDHVVMLTGDNRPTAESIAEQAGITEVMAELLPQDKVAAIEGLVSKYQHVAMVGDGVNDAPAMARASVGIAMGAVGSDAAIETADIALMSDDLSKLPWLIGHSRKTLSIIRQNIGLSLTVKAAFVVLTFAGVASLWAAIAADMGVSLLVIFNALRLLAADEVGLQG